MGNNSVYVDTADTRMGIGDDNPQWKIYLGSNAADGTAENVGIFELAPLRCKDVKMAAEATIYPPGFRISASLRAE